MQRLRRDQTSGIAGTHAIVLAFGALMAAMWPIVTADVVAQQGTITRVFHLRETAGIRRTEYPASVSMQIPRGALADAAHARVMNNSAEVPAQFTTRATWDDGSVQTLDIDLNASLDRGRRIGDTNCKSVPPSHAP
ncbi:MAG: hypothetical protein QM736_13330 [Vicinamibacterales bacterium]